MCLTSLPWSPGKMAASRVVSVLRVTAGTTRKCAALTSCLQVRNLSSGAVCTPGQWQLMSAVCLQRHPIVTSEPTQLEQKYGDMLAHLELECSILSDHELHAKEDRAIAEKKKQMEENDQVDGEVEGARVTALDMEDSWEVEFKEFTPASRVTEQDTTGDLHSTNRQLDQPLVLLVKQKLGDKSHWVFPQGPRQDGESMRQAAERVLQSHCGNAVAAQFLGNAPCGFYQYTFPETANMGTGAKVFFFKAWYKEGDVIPDNTNTSDYAWVPVNQLSQYCSRSYLRSVKDFLVNL